MARNLFEVKQLLRLVAEKTKGFVSGSQIAELSGVAKRNGEFALNLSAVSSSEVVGTAFRGTQNVSRFSPSGGGNNLPFSLQGGVRIRNASIFYRGLQTLSGELRSHFVSRASTRLLSTSNSVGRRATSNSGSSYSARLKGDVRGWRSYYVDKHGVQHFKRRGPVAWSDTLSSPRSMQLIGVAIVLGGVTYVMNLETVPYTHRKHFVLVSPELEKSIGERGFKMLLKEYKKKVLPPNHPETLRVHRIAAEVIQALMLGTNTSDWGELEKGGHDLGDIVSGSGWETVTKKTDGPLLVTYADHSHAHNDTLDEAWVDKSRKEGLKKGEEGFKKHLEGMKWQVIVVDDDIMNAVCLPGGKIVVFTGLLKKFRSDTEIATVLAHEVGHAVARHSAESLTHNLFLVAIQLAVLSVFYVPSLVNSVSELLLRLPFSRRMEIEADHIGLILMAAAGYDPRMAPSFYEKLGSLENAPEYAQYVSTHPSGKRRGEKLRDTATMEEAMTLYRQKVGGGGIEGFF